MLFTCVPPPRHQRAPPILCSSRLNPENCICCQRNWRRPPAVCMCVWLWECVCAVGLLSLFKIARISSENASSQSVDSVVSLWKQQHRERIHGELLGNHLCLSVGVYACLCGCLCVPCVCLCRPLSAVVITFSGQLWRYFFTLLTVVQHRGRSRVIATVSFTFKLFAWSRSGDTSSIIWIRVEKILETPFSITQYRSIASQIII